MPERNMDMLIHGKFGDLKILSPQRFVQTFVKEKMETQSQNECYHNEVTLNCTLIVWKFISGVVGCSMGLGKRVQMRNLLMSIPH